MATDTGTIDTADDNDEEEESYVLLELSGLTAEEFKNNSGQIHLLGVNSPNPFLKLDKCIFKGEYKLTTGTAVFFEESNEKIDNVPMMDYLCRTTKKLEMERVFLKPKQQTSDSPKVDSDKPEESGTDKEMDTT